MSKTYYSPTHEYITVDGDTGLVGITDYAQHQLGNVVYVDLPEEGDEVVAGEDFGAIESVKAASDLISPVSGEIIDVNLDLADNPGAINADAMGTWIIKVRLSDASELDNLLDEAAYKELCH